MLQDYRLHPAINKEACFKATPPASTPESLPSEQEVLKSLAENLAKREAAPVSKKTEPSSTSPKKDLNWTQGLYHWCCLITNENIPPDSEKSNPFYEQLLKLETRPAEEALARKTLFTLLCRFSGILDKQFGGPLSPNEEISSAKMLLEEAQSCPEGFLNRAFRVLSRLAQLKNLDEGFYLVRKKLVEQATIGLPWGNNVHIWNQVSLVAEDEGLGIQANYREDSYQDQDPALRDSIKRVLQKTFERYITPYGISELLMAVLLDHLARLGYEGKKEEGYAVAPLRQITDSVNQLLPELKLDSQNPESWKKLFYWRSTEETSEEMETSDDFLSFYDLKLKFILSAIYRSLINNGYIDSNKLQPRDLVDYAAGRELMKNANLQASELNLDAFNEPTQIQKLLDNERHWHWQLYKIFERYPAYWEDLLKRLDFSGNTEKLTEYLRMAPEELRLPTDLNNKATSQQKKELRRALIVLIAMLSTTERYGSDTINRLTRIFTEPSVHDHTYLSLTLQYHPDLFPKILEAMDQHKRHWPIETRRAMLFGTESSTSQISKIDILKQAVDSNNPQMLEKLLQFLQGYIADDPEISGKIKHLLSKPRHRYVLYHRFSHGTTPITSVSQEIRVENLVDYVVQSKQVKAGTLQKILVYITNNPDMFSDSESNALLEFDYATLRSNPEKLKVFLGYSCSEATHLSDKIRARLVPNAQQIPSGVFFRNQWLKTQWESLLRCVHNDMEHANMLLFLVSQYKLPIQEAGGKQSIAFILERLSLLNLSDSADAKLFKNVLSNIKDQSPLLQRLLTDNTVRDQCTHNLPELLHALLPGHLKSLQKECAARQEKLQLPLSPVHQKLKSFTSFFPFGSDEQLRLKQLRQETEFTRSWIEALTKPNSQEIQSALLQLRSNLDLDDARFLSENKNWNRLFDACYNQVNVPPSTPSSTPTARR